jgi:hypothetical protein
MSFLMKFCLRRFGIHGNILKIVIFIAIIPGFSSAACLEAQDSLKVSGQVSAWLNINPSGKLPVWFNGRYIPQLNLSTKDKKSRLFDSELSANIYGNAAFQPFDSSYFSGRIKPYRGWVRFSTNQLELRLGLQKINFGSASILRPLMWFDQLDPRDPLHLTDGVWALLGRYYFLNNVNIWVWGLYGNNKPMGWEVVPVNKRYPEFGGRIQLPVPGGEAAVSYHHRIADNRGMEIFTGYYDRIPEDRFGLDAKWDLNIGLWVEGSWTKKWKDIGPYTNEEILNAGIDYTFGIGNGLYVACEQLLVSLDEKPFGFRDKRFLSLATANYPLGLFDRLTGILFFDWSANKIYNFVSWQRQYDKITIYIMGYWNPETFILPSSTGNNELFSGKGIQLMFVFNH